MLGEVTGIDESDRGVLVENRRVNYGTLIVAVGVRNDYFGNEDWEKHAPGFAPAALQQDKYTARLVRNRLRNRAVPRFRYRHRGQMTTIGRAAAVADLGRLRFSGYFAWVFWLFVHLMALGEFENRFLVFFQ